ncbi:hypothetical protein [Liquorilactobacillus hordei]|uniref:Uncharacterized protein n=1 Tax=Liquorilactobacillus hordei DSM 19519 TaxID=1423759 RepID=A0A0R1MA47_9LACO|nr:hypothetical protein [Liquorilactobacillus hordei]KRL05040.1 hypothetical protein FC92_GL001709 [Liquorilactobacillus hordei DSM 19519]QYH51958.1 hypothetical protein G6O70_05590 [Liquorilactobacillus hordei DSM 19519]
MNKEETLKYLQEKQQLTVAVQNARHNLATANEQLNLVNSQFKKRLLITVIAGVIVPFMTLNSMIFYVLWLIGWWTVFIGLFVMKFRQGNGLKMQVQTARENLNVEENKQEYLAGANDFPNKFYSYWTIDRLIKLVKDNRAVTLQDAFNLAENQDFQNDQLALQQENLAVAKSTNTMASISAAANIGTFLNTRNK